MVHVMFKNIVDFTQSNSKNLMNLKQIRPIMWWNPKFHPSILVIYTSISTHLDVGFINNVTSGLVHESAPICIEPNGLQMSTKK